MTNAIVDARLVWDVVWQATLGLSVGLVASSLFRKRPARSHCVLWLSVIAAIGTPGFSFLARQAGWGLFRAGDLPATAERVEAAPTGSTLMLRHSDPLPGAGEATVPTVLPAPVELASTAERHIGRTPPQPAASVTAEHQPVSVEIVLPHLLSATMIVWAILSSAMILRLGWMIALAVQSVRRASKSNNRELETGIAAAVEQLGLKVNPQIRVSSGAPGPMIWCWSRTPIVIVPALAGFGSSVDWPAVFCHELAHYLRRDHWSALCSEVLVCLLPWHPLAWMAKWRLAELSEMACDDWVVQSGASKADYADSLLNLVPMQHSLSLCAVSGGSLASRIKRILNVTRVDAKIGSAWTLVASIAVLMACAIVALAQTRPGPLLENVAPSSDGTDVQPPRLQISGSVVDPEGRRVPGARLYWWELHTEGQPQRDDVRLVEVGTSGADGRFRLELDRRAFDWRFGAVPMRGTVPLVAAADGLGLNWVEVKPNDTDLTLQLPHDQVIGGRVVDSEGRPAEHVNVEVNALFSDSSGSVDTFLTVWNNEGNSAFAHMDRVLRAIVGSTLHIETDEGGRFEVRGIGQERVAALRLSGRGFADTAFYVVLREGFDPEDIMKNPSTQFRGFVTPPQIFGPQFTLVAEPTKVVQGTVQDATNGERVAGATVRGTVAWGRPLSAATDALGHFKLTGLAKSNAYSLTVVPPGNTSLIPRHVNLPDTADLAPVHTDISLQHGVMVEGRVVDKDTGEGLRAAVRFIPLPENDTAAMPEYDIDRLELRSTNEDGYFRIVTIPGPGVLTAVVSRKYTSGGNLVNPYRAATFNADDQKRVTLTGDGVFIAAHNTLERLAELNAVMVVDVPEEGPADSFTLVVDQGETVRLKVTDPEGSPLTGAMVAGATAAQSWTSVRPLQTAECTIYALEPSAPRTVVVYHPEQHLASVLTIRGDEGPTVTARLQPAATLEGVVVDSSGAPLAGANVTIHYSDDSASDVHRRLTQTRQPVLTDSEGRFRWHGVLPGLKFRVNVREGEEALTDKAIRIDPLDAGEVHTLSVSAR